MGFNEGCIVLNSPDGTFYPGKTVSGKLIFELSHTKTLQALYMKIVGFCKVEWLAHDTTHTYIRKNYSEEEYINDKVNLIAGETEECKLEPGYHEYPFSFQLPVDCPSSYEGPHGHVRYEIEAVVERQLKFHQKKKIEFNVVAPLDLNYVPHAKHPIVLALYDSYGCCCFNSGATETVVKAPISGYCPGQKLPIQIRCNNNGSVKINEIILRITKETTFIAVKSPDKKSKREIITETYLGPVPKRTALDWNSQLIVPAVDIHNLSACKYIDIDYYLEVVVSPGACHSEAKESCKIIFGTIPIEGYEDDIKPLEKE